MFKNKNQVILLAVVIVIVAAAAYLLLRGGGPVLTIDLLATLGDAEKRTNWAQADNPAFTVKDVTLAGDTRKAIFAPPHSRVSWRVEVPRRATLDLAFGLGPDAWTSEGDGAQFRIGVSDGRTYEEYLREVVNPRERERDRRWLTATVDLSAYEGQTVYVVLNTDPGPPGADKDNRNDFAYWGSPVITGR